MNRYDPFGPNQAVPSALKRLIEHPERANWQAAILLYKTCRRWPKWPLTFALAVVDGRFEIHGADFLIRPPVGWEELCDEALRTDVTPELIQGVGLAPRQGVSILNEIFGPMDVFCSARLRRFDDQRILEIGSGLRPTWSLADDGWGGLGESLQVSLSYGARVNFICPLPTEGSLSERAHKWAESFATAALAQRLLIKAIETPELVSKDAPTTREPIDPRRNDPRSTS